MPVSSAQLGRLITLRRAGLRQQADRQRQARQHCADIDGRIGQLDALARTYRIDPAAGALSGRDLQAMMVLTARLAAARAAEEAKRQAADAGLVEATRAVAHAHRRVRLLEEKRRAVAKREREERERKAQATIPVRPGADPTA